MEAFTINSTAILVSWQDVPAISQNGIITQYEVEYNQSRFAQVPMSDTTIVNASQLTVELTDLEEDVEYSIRVRAYTSVGPGPFSADVMNRTFEDGRFDLVSLSVIRTHYPLCYPLLSSLQLYSECPGYHQLFYNDSSHLGRGPRHRPKWGHQSV